MVFIRLLTIKDTMASGMNLWTPQLLDKCCQYGKEDFKNQIRYKKEYITCEKIKMIEVLCMKEN